MVTGKPMGAGLPLAGTTASRELVETFAGTGYFNTFASSPLQGAVGKAVIDIIEEEGLRHNVKRVGARLMEGLKQMQPHCPVMGDVRGHGLFVGVDLVEDPVTKAPDREAAADIVNALKDSGFLAGSAGALGNVLKLRPPLVLSAADADAFLAAFREVMARSLRWLAQRSKSATAERLERRWLHSGLAGGTLSLVAVSENVTFRVDGIDGDAYVLRLHRPGLSHARRARLGTHVDRRACRRGDGRARGRDHERRTATTSRSPPPTASDATPGVTRWIDGTPLGRVLSEAGADEHLRHFDAIGTIAATVHNQSSGWAAPDGFTRHAFDVAGLFGETPFWGRFWDSPLLSRTERRLVVRTRDAIGAVLDRYGAGARTYSLIHADLHFGNVLVDGDRLAVIDFDDCGFGWHQYELAVVLAGHPPERFDVNFASLLRGYRQVRAFPDEDAALVPMFVVVRALAWLGWIEQRPEHQRPGRVEEHKDRACALCESLAIPARNATRMARTS